MSQDRTAAIVVRNVDYSETSRIVTLFGPERGRIVAIAKGAQRAKSPTRGVLDTFNLIEAHVYWKDGRNVQTLGEVGIVNEFRGVKSDLAKSSYGAFVLEMVDRIAQANEPSQVLFSTLVAGLDQFDAWTGDVRTHCCWQVIGLLRAAGHAPSMDACCECGAAVPEVPWFSYAGGAVCERCRGDVRLSLADASSLRAIVDAIDACPQDLTVPARVFTLLGNYARRQVDTDFRSTRVIEQLYG